MKHTLRFIPYPCIVSLVDTSVTSLYPSHFHKHLCYCGNLRAYPCVGLHVCIDGLCDIAVIRLS